MAHSAVDLLTAVGSTNGTRCIKRDDNRLTLAMCGGVGNQDHKSMRSDSGSLSDSKKGSGRSDIAPGMGWNTSPDSVKDVNK